MKKNIKYLIFEVCTTQYMSQLHFTDEQTYICNTESRHIIQLVFRETVLHTVSLLVFSLITCSLRYATFTLLITWQDTISYQTFSHSYHMAAIYIWKLVQFSLVPQSCLTQRTAARQASFSITNSWGLLKLMSIESVMPSNHLVLCCPLLLLPSTFLSIRVFSNESVLRIRWPNYWSFSISPSNEYSGLISFRTDWFDLLGS